MTLSRLSLDRSRDELAKAWLVRRVEHASLEEIGEPQTRPRSLARRKRGDRAITTGFLAKVA